MLLEQSTTRQNEGTVQDFTLSEYNSLPHVFIFSLLQHGNHKISLMSSSCDRTHTVTVGMIKTAIECITLQSLGNEEFLVELTLKDAAALLSEEVFDVNEFHTNCHPPYGYFTNVSIMGLRSYVEDAEVLVVLTLMER